MLLKSNQCAFLEFKWEYGLKYMSYFQHADSEENFKETLSRSPGRSYFPLIYTFPLMLWFKHVFVTPRRVSILRPDGLGNERVSPRPRGPTATMHVRAPGPHQSAGLPRPQTSAARGPEAGSPRPRCLQGWLLPRPLPEVRPAAVPGPARPPCVRMHALSSSREDVGPTPGHFM